jgi:general secretion pathway protein K
MSRRRRPDRGAALLLAMLILALVATLASGMVWQQSRAIEVEAAERARAQSAWILAGAQDWARLILREDARAGGVDHLGEPWAVPLAEARLSTFLAADRDNTLDSALEAFLSGNIADAQSRYNLANLLDGQGQVVPLELRTLQRLCDLAGAPTDTADRLAQGLRRARGAAPDDDGAPLLPQRFSQLAWLGLDAAALARIEPFVTLLPARSSVNANTAPREVLAAVIDGLDLGSAERLAQRRERSPLRSVAELRAQLPPGVLADEARVAVSSRYFEVRGRLRLDRLVVEERALVERRGSGGDTEVVTLQRERVQPVRLP